ncbi:uncharacterized protein KY384_003744 [Bacidia gigantensis]|uniref:uncharacterized protein n=1 Tax=Bacidia gigantensis TaxID=2732470 RepID=UPI001D0430F2|nr:uncharacterized protein KY384_003744 [Bacidia gigantensis]KAG8532107.1 hypothetical protein KY384_003744 [Bacidia gigantensis]
MSGGFDFPPASVDTDSSSENHRPTTIDPRVTQTSFPQTQIDLLRQERMYVEQRRSSHDVRLAQQRPISALHASTRRQHHEDQAVANQNFPTSAIRPRVVGSRIRRRLNNNANASSRTSMHVASFGVGLPEPTLPRVGSAAMVSAEYSGEAEVNRRRKRCKLDEDRLTRGTKTFSYGWKGQVVPGPLRMEIHSCDGGLHNEAFQQDRHQYHRDNMLCNDKSVYCTDRGHCNIILKHVGEASFELKKLVIKAPESGFTAPIQEGMIFISMTSKDLLSRTSPYHLCSEYPSDCESGEGSLSCSTPLSSSRPISRRRDSAARSVPPPVSDIMLRTFHRNDWRISEPYPRYPISTAYQAPNRYEVDPESIERRMSPSNVAVVNQGFIVTSHCNDPSGDEEEESSPATLADRYNREHMPNTVSPTSEEDADETFDRAMRERRLGLSPNRLPYQMRRGRRKSTPSTFEVVDDEECKVAMEDVLAPHAEFFIEKDKSVVSISFEPPV